MHQCIKFILFLNDTAASCWFYYRNNITMHGPMNVKQSSFLRQNSKQGRKLLQPLQLLS